jgi:hypothetical protein
MAIGAVAGAALAKMAVDKMSGSSSKDA